MTKPANREISSLKTVGTFFKRQACSDTLFTVLNNAFGHPLNDEGRATMPLAGGIMQHGYQCGMLWGSTLAAGAEAHRRNRSVPQAIGKAIMAARGLVDAFQDRHKTINCIDITHIDKSSSALNMIHFFLIKGGTIECFRMAAAFAPIAYRVINAALSKTLPAAPISCATLLAQRVGASPMHATMAAGLAGGIGLCGGACGALGTAIWLAGLKSIQEGNGALNYKSPTALGIIDRFFSATNYEIECANIVGRKFENIQDHTQYIRQGGCSSIIDALAGEQTPYTAMLTA